MISSIFNLSISMLIPFCAGYTLIFCLDQKYIIPLSFKIALAYGQGLGLLAIWMLCLGIFRQQFNLFTIGMPLIVASSIFLIWGLLRRKRHVKFNEAPIISKKSTPQQGIMKILKTTLIILLIVFIAQNIIYIFWRSMTFPISMWDAIATIAFKAKIFFFERSLPPLELLPHSAYPLLVPFIESWIAFNLDYWDEVLVKIIFPCAFLSYLTIHYKFLEHFTNKTWALLGCAILLSSNFFIFHATISYRDFFMMYFNCITIMLLIYWSQNKENSFLIIAALFAGFATFTKLEGTGYLLIHTLLVIIILGNNKAMIFSEKIKKFLLFAIPSYLLCLPFHIYKFATGIAGMSGRMGLEITQDHFARLPVIISDFASNLFWSGNWNIIWFLLLISLICHHKKLWHSTAIKLLIFPLLMFFLTYFFILTLTPAKISNFGLFSRIILHFFPLSVLLIILLNYSGFSYGECNANSEES